MEMRIAGAVLAGGEGRRLGGSKALTLLAGQPLVAHGLARLSPQVAHVVLCAGADKARLSGLAETVLDDPFPERSGPFAGVVSALAWGAAQGMDWMAVVPCDMPFLPRDLVVRLFAETRADVPRYASSDRGAHYGVALWPTALAARANRLYAEDDVRSLRAALLAFGAVPCDLADMGFMAFLDVNTPDALAVAEDHIAKDHPPTDEGE